MTDVVRDMKLAKKMSNLNKNTRLSYEENLSYSFFEPYQILLFTILTKSPEQKSAALPLPHPRHHFPSTYKAPSVICKHLTKNQRSYLEIE